MLVGFWFQPCFNRSVPDFIIMVGLTILAEPIDMPIFEYICQQCDHHFEAIVQGNQKAACPKCKSKRLSQQLSSFAVGGERSQSSDRPVSACGTCGDPRGPGACSMN